MKPEYDFSKGVRGKFFRPEAELRPPVYLDSAVQRYLGERLRTRMFRCVKWSTRC